MKVALNDSARALSAELPTLLIDCRTPAVAQAAAKALDVYCSVVGVHDRPGEAAAGRGGVGQSSGDEVGAHVVGDSPADQATAVAVDDWLCQPELAPG